MDVESTPPVLFLTNFSPNLPFCLRQGVKYERWRAHSLRNQHAMGLNTQMQFLLEYHHQDLPRHKSKSPVQAAQAREILMLVVIEQGRKLPWMEMGGGDPYCICWHEENKPDMRKLDTLSSGRGRGCVVRNCRNCRNLCGAYCCCCEDETPYLEHAEHIIETKPVYKVSSCILLPTRLFSSGSVEVSLIDTSPALPHLDLAQNINDPRWGHHASYKYASNPRTMSKTGSEGRGYLIIEVYDHDYIGQDDPMGRVEISLDDIPLDTISEEWYNLGWIPGQTRPAPQGEIQIKLLLSHEFAQNNWLIKAKSHDFVAIQEEIDMCSKVAEKSQLTWYLHEVIHEAFMIFDVDGGGEIEPPELAHMMSLLGEEVTPQELAYMIAECKKWGQPRSKPIVMRRSGRTHSMGGEVLAKMTASREVETFQPAPTPEVIDIGVEKLDETEFRMMLTEYWTQRKYGDRTLGAVHDKFKSLKRKGADIHIGGRQSPGDSEVAVETDSSFKTMRIEHAPESGSFAENVMPTPGWMTDIAVDHKRLRPESRTPQMFWCPAPAQRPA